MATSNVSAIITRVMAVTIPPNTIPSMANVFPPVFGLLRCFFKDIIPSMMAGIPVTIQNPKDSKPNTKDRMDSTSGEGCW